MDNVINVRLLSHPLNWGIVWVVLLVTSYAFAKIALHLGGGDDCGCGDASHPD